MSSAPVPLDPDQSARFDQELAELRDRWISHLPSENRAPLDDALQQDPFLTHQVFALVDEGLPAHKALAFLFGAARHLADVPPEERRPILAGLLNLTTNGGSE